MNVYEVDQQLIKLLEGIEGLPVYEDTVPGGAQPGGVYAVFFGGDLTPRAKAVSMVSPRYSALMHTFAVMVAARTARVRNQVREEVRNRLVGWAAPGVGQVRETGQLNSYGDTDATIQPLKYACYMTFQTMISEAV
jgi:hypothetical protein